MSLLQESLLTGAATVPVFFLASSITRLLNLKMSQTTETAISSFLTGFLFHLGAEASGVNEWYALHGQAIQKKKRRLQTIRGHVRPCSSPHVCPLALRLAEES
jgi:hypothetical protein